MTDFAITIPALRHPWLAAVLSAVIPGLGQWYAGARRRAILLFAPFAAAVAAAVWLLSRGKVELVAILVQPAWLTGLAAANILVAVLRAGAAADAYRIAGGRWREWASIGTAAAVLVLMAPHAVAGAYAADLLGVLESVFVSDDVVLTASADAARMRGSVSMTTAAVAAEERGSIAVLADGVLVNQPDGIQRQVTPAFGEIPPVAMGPFDEEVGRVTVLLAGGDAGPGRIGLRTDVMIVATLDLRTGLATLFSVSRELVGFPMPSSWAGVFEDREELFWSITRNRDLAGTSQATDPAPEVFEPQGIWPDRINAIYPYAVGELDAFYPASPDPAMEALADTLEIALGIPIPYWILVDMEGFVDLVDAIGGVDVNALEPMNVIFSPERTGAEPIHIQIDPGRHHLDGRLALAYVRNRSDSDDFVRTRRQRCMLREVAAAADPVTILANFGAITDAIRDHTTTNIPLRFLPEMIEAVGGIDRTRITTTAFQAGYYGPDSNYRGLRLVDVDRVRAAVQEMLDGMARDAVPATEDECR